MINATNNPYPESPDLSPSKLDKGGYEGNAETLDAKIDAILAEAKVLIDNTLVGSSSVGSIVPSSVPPATGAVHAFATQAGTYTNWGGFVVPANTFAFISRSADLVFSISQTTLDVTGKLNVSDVVDNLTTDSATKVASSRQVKILNEKNVQIKTWTAIAFASGDQVNHLGKDWVSNAAIISTDIPGVSSKWVERLTAYAEESDVYQIIGQPILKSYPKDFSLLNTTTANTTTWINNLPITTRGKLYSMRVKAPIGSVISAYVYSITGTSGSFAYTKLHDFSTFITTSLEHTQNILDEYILEAGQFIAYKSSLGIYYTASGSGYNVPNTGIYSQTYAMDYYINENVISGIKDRVLFLEDSNSTIKSNLAIPFLKSYPKTFSSLNSITTNGSTTWINNVPITTRGKLYSMRVKAPVGSVISPYAYSITGTSGSLSYIKLHDFPSFITTSLEYTQAVVDEYILEAGQFIAYKSSLGIYYTASGSGYNVPSLTISSQTYAMDYYINENVDFGINNRVAILESNKNSNDAIILDLQTNSLKNVVLKPSILYRNILSSISDFTSVNWSLASGGGAEPNGIGSANHFWLKKRYHVNPRTLDVNITLLPDSVFYIECAPLDYVQNNGVFVIDVPNNKISINNVSSGVLTETASATIPFSIVSGRKYVVSTTILNFNNKMTIGDTVTGDSFSISYMPPTTLSTTQNTQSDSYKFYLNSGTTSGFKINNVTISSKLKPLILLIGDSITAGVLLPAVSETGRYGRLLEAKLKGNVLISARGGAVLNDVANKLETELAFIKPDYCMLTIGTNLTGFSQTALTAVVNRIIELGSIPIINHVPNRGIGTHIATNNTIDAVCLATGAIRGCLFDLATSIGNDPANSYIVSDYFADGVHPNVSGQLKMFNRFEIDLPFLFI